jgi:hypothetical protein
MHHARAGTFSAAASRTHLVRLWELLEQAKDGGRFTLAPSATAVRSRLSYGKDHIPLLHMVSFGPHGVGVGFWSQIQHRTRSQEVCEQMDGRLLTEKARHAGDGDRHLWLDRHGGAVFRRAALDISGDGSALSTL